MNIITLLTIISSTIFLICATIYNKDTLLWKIKPNLVTRSLFTLITLINAISYFSFTGSIFKSALAFTDFIVCLVVTLFIIYKKYSQKPTTFEVIIILLACSSLLVRYLFNSALWANILLQPSYILAFLPTYKNTWDNPHDESAIAWFLFASSFIFTIIIVILSWNTMRQDFFNPSIAFLLHVWLGFLALRKTK